MKKTAVAVMISAIFALGLNASGKTKDSRFIVNDIMKIQMPGKFIKNGKLQLSAQQMEQLAKTVKPIMHQEYNTKMQKAFLMEKRIQRGIKQGRDIDQLNSWIDELTQIKQDAIKKKLTAYNNFMSILTKEQKEQLKKLQTER